MSLMFHFYVGFERLLAPVPSYVKWTIIHEIRKIQSFFVLVVNQAMHTHITENIRKQSIVSRCFCAYLRVRPPVCKSIFRN